MLVPALGALWLAALFFGVSDGVRTEQGWAPLELSSAADETRFPTILAVGRDARASPPLQSGDRLVALEGTSLAGSSAARVWSGIAGAARERGFAALSAEREGGVRIDVRFELTPTPYWWAFLPVSVAVFAMGAFLLLRVPHWHLAQPVFVAAWAFAMAFAVESPARPPTSLLAETLDWIGSVIGVPLLVWTAQALTRSALPVRNWQKALVGVAVALQVADGAFAFYLPSGRSLQAALGGATALTVLAGVVAGVTRAYRLSDALERRQIRWLVLGFYVTTLGIAASNLTGGATSAGIGRLVTAGLSLALPLSFVVAVAAYDFLDVDRVISATASYSLVGVGLFAGALAGIPRVAEWVASPLDIDPEPARFALTLGLIGLAVPAHRALSARIDRQVFEQRHERRLGFERLIDEIGVLTTLEALFGAAADRLATLLGPESIAIYLRNGALFTPALVKGRTAPPAFEADGLLVRTLGTRSVPLAAEAASCADFEHAALDTIGAAVLLPIRRGAGLAAFACLGRKRSGDIYTHEEMALLAALANRCSELFTKLSTEALLEEARALQHSLRRYVPGAVAEEILSGRDLAPEEREVSVLFVDIRGYSSFAERRRADEIFSTLNTYTETVSGSVMARGGSVVEFNGDGMMAVFGAPKALEGKESAAVAAAREVVDSITGELSVGVGIATGPAYVGSIRAADRWIWSAVGNTTNLAARLQALTRSLDASIAIDEATRERADGMCADFVLHPGIAIRGRSDRQDVFTLPLARAADEDDD
jgi:class 3 adenylate cyclase